MAGRGGASRRQAGLTVADLVPDPANRRQHNPKNIGMVVDALRSVGAGRSIVIDEDDVVLAGNGVREAATKAGITKVRVIETDGQEIIAVRRTGLSADQKRALAIFDNRTGELSAWNVDQLQADADAGLSLRAFWSAEEEAELLRLSQRRQGNTDPDAVPAVRATDIRVGDLFELGAHRLLCGDSTDPAVVARLLGAIEPGLMVTDPPYGVNYDPAWRAKAGVNKSTQKLGKVTNDDRADWSAAWRLFPGQVAYVWHAGLKAAEVEASLVSVGFEMRAQIIWAKDRMALGRGDYHWQHEPCWYAVRAGALGGRTLDRTQTTLWRVPSVAGKPDDPSAETSTVWEIPSREDAGHTHGTQKPVECMARAMRNHRALDVYDPFVGSGSSVIAAEMLCRRLLAVDIEPTYCQVAIDRWEAFTGLKAGKV